MTIISAALRDKMMKRIEVLLRRDVGNKQPTPDQLDQAYVLLMTRVQLGPIAEKDLRAIAAQVSSQKAQPQLGGHSSAVNQPPTPPADDYRCQPPTQHTSANATPAPATPIPQGTISSLSTRGDDDATTLIANTSKKQRKILADREWSKKVEEDRVNGRLMAVKDKEDHFQRMMAQRKTLDQQKAEIDAYRAEQARLRQLQKEQMDEHIAEAQFLTKKEKEEAHNKAVADKKFRERQQREADEERMRQREQERQDQLRQVLMFQEEERKQRDAERQAKLDKQAEWKRNLEDNERKLKEKAEAKVHEREEDREYQRRYAENQIRLEKEREDTYARKADRQRKFQSLADVVAKQFEAKEQNLNSKIDEEYQQQLDRNISDERSRKQREKERTRDCLNFQQQQLAEKRRQQEAEREEGRRIAERVRQEIELNHQQELAQKIASRQEAARMRQFLDTQLQMAHYKETQQPETSIMRPPEVAANMYSTARVRDNVSRVTVTPPLPAINRSSSRLQ